MSNLMVTNLVFLAVIVSLSGSVLCQNNTRCGTCDSNSCEVPRNCRAGLVKDSCDCCYWCGNREGQRCEHEDLNTGRLGRCGDNLECRMRSDLVWDDPPEAVCVCVRQDPICGSDGVTYDNICQFTEARYSRRNGLRAVSTTPCIKPPVISSPPQNIQSSTGSYAVLTCEARAYPLATILWEHVRNHTTFMLPGNNSLLAVQTRSGPYKDETTSWLLFLSLSEENEGTYICNAENDVGSTTDSAIVTVIN